MEEILDRIFEIIKVPFSSDIVIKIIDELKKIKINQLVNSINTNIITNILATVCTIVPVVIENTKKIFKKIFKISDKILAFDTNSIYISENNHFKKDNIKPSPEIIYKKKHYDKLTVTNVAVWNKGSRIITKENFTIYDKCGNKFLNSELKYCDINSVNQEINKESDKINVEFEYLKPGEGFVIQVVQNSNYNDIAIHHEMIDVDFQNRSKHIFRMVLAIVLFVVLVMYGIFTIGNMVVDILNSFGEKDFSILMYFSPIIIFCFCSIGVRYALKLVNEGLIKQKFEVFTFRSGSYLKRDDFKENVVFIKSQKVRVGKFCKKKFVRKKLDNTKLFIGYNIKNIVNEVYIKDENEWEKVCKKGSNKGDDIIKIKLKKADDKIKELYLGKSVKYVINTFER